MQKKCSLENLIFPEDYFEDEVREGFFVSGMMKRYWACQLKVLSEIDRICRRHGLNWYADYGSLMGAVRHWGYIPWDDDFDITMKRCDYEKFFEYAKEELPKGYVTLNVKENPEYEVMLGRVVNSRTIDYGKQHLQEFYGCPYTVGVDIFPIDGLYADEEKEEDRRKRANKLAEELARLGSRDRKRRRELFLKIDEIYSECPSEDAEYLAFMPFWVERKSHRFPAAIFENILKLDFENTQIRVPSDYETLLDLEYGDFINVYKSGGIHDYPVYIGQEDIFKESVGKYLFRYTFSQEDLAKAIARKSFEEKCKERIEMLKTAHSQIAMLVKAGDADNAASLLGGCQNIAVSLGEMLEGKYGDGTEAVRQLENYCETVFNCSESWDDNSAAILDKAADMAFDHILELIHGSKKVVFFIPVRAVWWKTMEPVYKKYLAEGNDQYEVHVMPIPWYRKINGEAVGDVVDESSLFPEGVVTDSYRDYDLIQHHHDIIVTHFPYDSYDGSVGILKSFYAENLVNACDKLVYVPPFETEDPEPEDRLTASLGNIIEQPAVVYGDEAVLFSEKIRELYIKKMTALTGDDSALLWKKKMVVIPGDNAQEPQKNVNKVILYSISGGFLIRHRQEAIEKIDRSLKIFEEQGEKLQVIVCPTPDVRQIAEFEPDLFADLEAKIHEYADRGVCVYDEDAEVLDDLSHISGYYGDRSAIARACVNLGIPVMIESVEV